MLRMDVVITSANDKASVSQLAALGVQNAEKMGPDWFVGTKPKSLTTEALARAGFTATKLVPLIQ